MPNDRSLYQIALSVSDLDEAIKFYRDIVGLKLIKQFDIGPKLAFFDLRGPRLMLEQSDGNSGVFYLYVQNIGQSVEALKAKGAVIEQDPTAIFQDAEGLFGEAGQSELLAFIKDPSGNLVGLMSRE